MPRSETYPPHLQRAIDEAEAKQAKRAGIVSRNTPRNNSRIEKKPPARPVADSKAPSRRDRLNATEAAYLAHLQILKAAGEISWIGEHESIAFRIADGKGRGKKASYRPDFPAIDNRGRLVLFEVKGFWREAARLRIKVAASTFGFRFVAVRKQGEGWSYEEFGFGPRAEEGAHR